MIEVSGLTFAYAGSSSPAISDVSFRVERGEVFGFLGPSGAGKSTTQKIITRQLKGFSGKVRVFDRHLTGWSSDYFERIGVSFEFPNHYLKLTAAENLRYFASLYQAASPAPEASLAEVGLADSADMPVSQYSKGMKTRLGVARAMQHRPELLFLDEPTAGLDPSNCRRIRDLILDRRAQGATVFLTTHDMNTVDAVCDRAAFIVDGRIAAIDRPREMKLRHGAPQVRVEIDDNGGWRQRTFELDGLADNPEFLEMLRSGKVRTLHSQEATLEDIFNDVTGHALQ